MRIELIDIHKHYGATRANDGVSLTIAPGTIHGILGENGAGKSTLMKILSGYSPMTSGTIRVGGAEKVFTDPSDAAALGIGMLYQDPMDFSQLTVLENFMLGQPGNAWKSPQLHRSAFQEIMDRLGFQMDPLVKLSRLTIGERQQLEIIRLLSVGTQVLILDEPTTGISAVQKTALFEALERLAADGKSIVLVSHKLEDVEHLCHHVTVLTEGRVAGEMDRPFDTNGLLEMMFQVPPVPPAPTGLTPGNPVMTLTGISASGGRSGLHDCSVTLHENEVIGLAGLEGSGQGVFLRVAAGLTLPYAGIIEAMGENLTGRDAVDFQNRRIMFLPASRLEEGLVSGLTLEQHYALRQTGASLFIDKSRARKRAKNAIRDFKIKGQPKSRVESLSGGNQQRILLSFLSTDSRLLLLENPTRGLDIESANWVWRHLHGFCKEHRTSIVFSCAELDEILMVADRVLVFFDGRIIRDVSTREIDVNELGMAIAGKTAGS